MPAYAANQSISQDALEVLGAVNVQGNTLILPGTQLERKLYVEVNEVLTRLGGSWNRKAKGHLFDTDPTDKLTYVLSLGTLPPKNPDAFFPTPHELVQQMFNHHDDLTNYLNHALSPNFLEPSAGNGAIASPLKILLDKAGMQKCTLDCVEINPERTAKLKVQGLKTFEQDFLTFKPEYNYDRIYMNPPFAVAGSPLAYISHIHHAYNLLDDGGRLVAIAPAGFVFRTDKTTEQFRAEVDRVGYYQSNPDDAFKASGTMVKTVTIVMDK